MHHRCGLLRARATVGRDGREDVRDVNRVPLQFINMGAVAQHDHPVAE